MIYTDENRGTIQHRDLVRIINYAGVRYGSITPTDIDGFVEYHNEVFIIFEVKKRGAKLPDGQRLAFKRFVDMPWALKKYGYLVKLVHDDLPEGADIIAAECEVEVVYFNGQTVINPKIKSPAEMLGFLVENRPTEGSAFLMPCGGQGQTL